MTMDIDISGETFTIAEDAAAKRFTVAHAGKVIGLADYIDRAAGVPMTPPTGTVRIFTHTEVSPEWGGRGLAAKLVRYALETSAEEGLKFRTTCSYVQNFLAKNGEFDKFVA
jgi:predicted GNAT family acetyltransferase